jgi:NAD(P)-dependent dehydrogenase (short-subunit alcohol dehydrogenase family)
MIGVYFSLRRSKASRYSFIVICCLVAEPFALLTHPIPTVIMSGNRMRGKVAVITGAASGFGKGIATKFIEEGAQVIIADISDGPGKQAASELGAVFQKVDVTQRPDWEALLAFAMDKFGQLDVVVNNAGASYSNKATTEVTEQEFDLVMNVNVKSIFHSTDVLVPYFLETKRPGCFVQIASTAGIRPRGGLTWYCASKGAVITATKALAAEHGPNQIRFNAVSPVVGVTGMTHLFLGKEGTPENLKGFVSTVPLGRPSTPSDVANACCYLASDEASFITGVNLEVDGGRCV